MNTHMNSLSIYLSISISLKVLYMRDDPNLFTLIKDPDAMRSFSKNPNVVAFSFSQGKTHPQGSSISLQLSGSSTSTNSTTSTTSSSSSTSTYELEFNIIMDSVSGNALANKYVKESSMKAGVNAFDSRESGELDGIWSDPSSSGGGGLIHVESNGIQIKFTEVPILRKWGTTEALLIGGKLRYADFRDKTSPLYYPQPQPLDIDNSQVSILAQDAPQFLNSFKTNGGLDVGSIYVTSRSINGVSSGVGMSISWSNQKSAWFKQPKPLRYRFLKLTVREREIFFQKSKKKKNSINRCIHVGCMWHNGHVTHELI